MKMTNKELQDKIYELKNEIAILKKAFLEITVGFEDDELFLFSADEYEKYKGVIPQITCWWWLRSPGHLCNYAGLVTSYGSVSYIGSNVSLSEDWVRPALKYKDDYNPIGSRAIIYAFPWIKIDTDLWIAEVPIGTHRFDEKSNDYATSEIRQYLQEWKESR